MHIVHQDTKRGFIELVPETLDDLWHLSHIISQGDLVSSRTTRRIQDTTGERLRSDRGIKKTFLLQSSTNARILSTPAKIDFEFLQIAQIGRAHDPPLFTT
jgi:hypothetical protein